MGRIAVFPRANKFTVKKSITGFGFFLIKKKYLLLSDICVVKRLLVLHTDGCLLLKSGVGEYLLQEIIICCNIKRLLFQQ